MEDLSFTEPFMQHLDLQFLSHNLALIEQYRYFRLREYARFLEVTPQKKPRNLIETARNRTAILPGTFQSKVLES